MAIKYYKLFDLINRKGMKKSDLRNIVSSATVAKLSKGEYVSGEVVEKICKYLKCQPGDIMEYVPDIEDLTDEDIKRMSQKAITKNLPGIKIPSIKDF